MPVRTKLVRIGHSRGVRIPRALIDLAELTEELELDAVPGQIVIRAVKPRRLTARERAARHDAYQTLAALAGSEPDALETAPPRRRESPRPTKREAD